jgi:RNA polymerase sigma factor (TIGR02999 family)
LTRPRDARTIGAVGADHVGMTELLRRWSGGDGAALDRLAPVIHHELRKLAAAYVRRERRAGLTPTELVSEAFVKLCGGAQPAWDDRAHFFGVAARLMRQILVDSARRRAAGKRGAGVEEVTFDEGLVVGERPAELLALDAALAELALHDERKVRVVEMHYFAGMEHREIAVVLGIHVNTVARDLRLAEAWLNRTLRVAR